jgi:DNA mismatch repair protein MutS
MPKKKKTPMMEQYSNFKKQYPDKIVLFRMGDFFETFGDDAKTASKVLNITLTSRNKGTDSTPLAGFPHKAMDQYLPKLIEAGYCVVVVDQLEDPKLSKGIVKRGVTRIVTPGTLDGEQADSIKNSFLASFYTDKKTTGVSICDMSTGEFQTLKVSSKRNNIENVISSYKPAEILLLEDSDEYDIGDIPIQFVDKGIRNISYVKDFVQEFYNVNSLKSLSLEEDSQLISVAMILKYIQETQLMEPKHIEKPRQININGKMILDKATIKNLELVEGAYSGKVKDSLFAVIDKTETRMGSRLLYHWILNPLIEREEIDKRLNMVNRFFNDKELLNKIREELSSVSDIERIVGKIGLGRANARDFNALQTSLEAIIKIAQYMDDKYISNVKKLTEIVERIDKAIDDDPPTVITEGGIIKDGFDKEVDELREMTKDSKGWIQEFEKEEQEKTGISSLKIDSNKVFGYYIEVTKTHQDKVPDRYIRKQTLVNSERYITEELKEKENIILNSQEKLFEIEYTLFCKFRESFFKYIQFLQEIAKKIARLDVLTGFANLAITSDYCKPDILDMGEEEGVIDIKDSRHPIVEKSINEDFISNDAYLDFQGSNMNILTGPNMSGKSTYIRQIATIVLMAQIGCFVPASSAKISLVDRIFTRVGASDDLSSGRSTFMVEMDEAANIVNNATKYSLVVLDEIGRGTSTYDGVSIAWALAEYLIKNVKARTLFATHYHELLRLSERIPDRIKNLNVLVEEDLEKGTVIFLRKIVEGGTDRSYGIYVAKMAGLPDDVINRANEILESFEQEKMFKKESELRDSSALFSKSKKKDKISFQYPLLTAKDSEIEKEIQELDTDNITPMEALSKINEWKKKV